MSLIEFLFTLYVVGVAPWLLAGWLRIPQYARYFQAAEYKASGYWLVLASTKAEKHYFRAFLIILIASFITSLCFSFSLPPMLFEQPIAMIMVNLGLIFLAISFAPHSLTGNTLYKREPQLIRLIITAFLIELVPTIISVWVISEIYALISDTRNSPETMVLIIGATSMMTSAIISVGPISFILTRYSVIIANFLNNPMR